MNKPAIAGQSVEQLLWANNLLEQQNEILKIENLGGNIHVC